LVVKSVFYTMMHSRKSIKLYKFVSGCIIHCTLYMLCIYILYLILYFSLYSTQRGCLTWKKIYSHCSMQQLKVTCTSEIWSPGCSVDENSSLVRKAWWCFAAQRTWSPNNTMSCTRRLIFSYTSLTGQQHFRFKVHHVLDRCTYSASVFFHIVSLVDACLFICCCNNKCTAKISHCLCGQNYGLSSIEFTCKPLLCQKLSPVQGISSEE
jgi:hypothetical protein